MASNIGAQMQRKMTRAADEIQRARQTALSQAGMAAKNIGLAEIRSDTGDGTLSGFKRGGKVGVRYDVQGDTVSVRMTGGAAAILERGRQKAKPIRPRKKRAILTPWGPRASATGSTTPGHHTFDHTMTRATPRMVTAARTPIVAAVRRGMSA